MLDDEEVPVGVTLAHHRLPGVGIERLHLRADRNQRFMDAPANRTPGRFSTLLSKRAAPQWVAVGETVILLTCPFHPC